MCKYFSCIVKRSMEVVWDGNDSTHEGLLKKAGLKDDKLENREFVRVEMVPSAKGFFTQKKEDWDYTVDEEGTLPEWYSKNEKKIKEKVWETCKVSFKPYAKNLKEVGKFISSLKKIEWFSFKGKINASWHMGYGVDLGAARDAAEDAARGAAGDAARGAARDAAWDAAEDAARGAAGDAAEGAAWDAARGAARDASLFARCLLVKDKIAKKHFNHAKARMEVWKAGYGLKCDMNGKLYVYAIKKPEGGK